MMTETATRVRIRTVDIIVAPAIAIPYRTERRRSFRVLLSFLAVLLVANAGLALLVETGPEHLRDPEYGLRLKSLRERRREHPDRKLTVILGSSRTAMGIRPDAYEASLADSNSSPLLFNLSMSGAGPVLQLIALERLLADGIRPDAVLLEFWPALLRGDGPYREDLRLNPERLRASDNPIIAEFFADPEKTQSRMLRGRALPAWYHRRAFLDQYWPQAVPRLERTDASWAPLDGWGWLPGRKSATAEQIELGWPHVAGFYAPLFHGFHVAEFADRALRSCVRRCRDLGISVTFVTLPESARFRSLIPTDSVRRATDYRTKLLADTGVPLIDGAAWATDAVLPDGYHLTQDGAEAFTRKLAGHIAPPR